MDLTVRNPVEQIAMGAIGAVVHGAVGRSLTGSRAFAVQCGIVGAVMYGVAIPVLRDNIRTEAQRRVPGHEVATNASHPWRIAWAASTAASMALVAGVALGGGADSLIGRKSPAIVGAAVLATALAGYIGYIGPDMMVGLANVMSEPEQDPAPRESSR